MVRDEVEVLGNKLEDFFIMEPQCRLLVDFDRGRVKNDHVTPIF